MAGSEVESNLVGLGSKPIARTGPWAVNNAIADGSTKVLCKAAPGAGKALYVTHFTVSKVSAATDIAFELQDEDDNSLFGPIYLVDNGEAVFKKDFPHPIKLTANKALYAYSPGGKSSDCTVWIEGFTAHEEITR